jgi:Domain of unknown function (DUF4124)
MRVLRIVVWLSVLWVGVAWGQMYKWTDQQGTVHFTDNVSQIPPAYRAKAQMLETSPPSQPSAAATPSQESAKPPPAVSAPAETPPPAPPQDRLGRGPDYWQSLAKGWSTQLRQGMLKRDRLQLLYDGLRAVADNTRDVWERGRLEAQVAQLQQSIAEVDKRIQEAQEMLQTTLPAEALRLGADPDWLKEAGVPPQ